jgi:hypothetical protein
MENVAIRKVDKEGYTVCGWEAIHGGVVFELARELEPEPDNSRKWEEGSEAKVFVSDEEGRREYERYEKDTGNCPECLGKGEVWVGWNKDTGNKYKPCEKCNATGFADGRSLFNQEGGSDESKKN